MKKFLVTLILLLITLPAWAGNTILIIGDSLSAGYGIDPQQGWVALLQQRISNHHFNYSVVNDSISGDTTSNGLNRLPAALKLYHPTITIIELGGNDALRGLQLFVIKNNLQQMVAQVQAAGSQVLMLGVRIPPNYGWILRKLIKSV
jgi:acyl-CoA thioesterase-1